MISVVLLLGGNEGRVEETFAAVRGDLQREVGAIVGTSSLMRSVAWGYASNAEFLNQAVQIETSLDALSLLDATQKIEERWGRNRELEMRAKAESEARYCDRTIDIDIIFYGRQIINNERLTVPHALMAQRKFVLEPLAELMPSFVHPVVGRRMDEMLKDLDS